MDKPSGWSIDDGSPGIWWYVRLRHNKPVLLSDESDARNLESSVSITIGTETPIGKMAYAGDDASTSKWGYFYAFEHSNSVDLRIAVSPANFDRILASVRNGKPPTVTVGFGPESAFEELAGPIVLDKATNAYRWDNETKAHVVIESCRFDFSRMAIDTDAPGQSEEAGAIFRVVGAAFTMIWNAIAVLITLAVFNATNTTFETAVVSVLALIYLTIITFARELPRSLAAMELSQLVRFYQLRALVGLPAAENETTFMAGAQKRLHRYDAKFFINSLGSGVIALIVIYKLITLIF